MGIQPEELQCYVKLMTEHQGAIRAYIVSLMPGSPDVGDVLQETNVVLWQKRNQFEEGTNFLAWAFTIARYEVMHQRDRAKRDGRIVFSDRVFEVVAEVEPPDQPHEGFLAALDHCLEKLSSEQQDLIRARYLPGNSLEAHADRAGRSAGSLRVALHRIRRALKRCIETKLGEKAI